MKIGNQERKSTKPNLVWNNQDQWEGILYCKPTTNKERGRHTTNIRNENEDTELDPMDIKRIIINIINNIMPLPWQQRWNGHPLKDTQSVRTHTRLNRQSVCVCDGY